MRTARHSFNPAGLNDHSLESRDLMAIVFPVVSHPIKAQVSVTTTVMPNASQDLNQIYNAFVHAGGSAAGLSTQFPFDEFQGNSVGVAVKVRGNFNTALAQLKALGMSVNAMSAVNGLIEGFAPIAQLPTIASMSQSVASTMRPVLGFRPGL